MHRSSIVVVEKPFAPTVSECDALIRLAREQQRILTVYQNRRWDADFDTLRFSVLPQLGRIVEFETHFDRYCPDADLAATAGAGTGAVFDLGTHLIDQALVLFGKPDRVSGFLSAQRDNGPENFMDACTVLLHYESGLLVTVKASAVSADPDQLRFWVRGTKGSYKKVRVNVESVSNETDRLKYHLDMQEPQVATGLDLNDETFGVDPLDRAGKSKQRADDARFTDGFTDTLTAGTVVQWQDATSTLRKTCRPNDPPKTYGGFYASLASSLQGKPNVPVPAEEARDVIRIVELAIASSKKGVTLDVV